MEAKVITRHSPDCKRKKERYWRGCNCRKWIYIAGQRKRISANTRSWEKAEELARQMEKDAAEAEEKAKKLAAGEEVARDRKTVNEAIDQFLQSKKDEGVGESTLSKLNTIFNKQLRQFCVNENLIHIDQFKLEQVEKFRSTWLDEPLAASKKKERIKSFFNYCVDHDWIAKNPIKKNTLKIIVKHVPTLYFNQQEFAKILDAVPLMYQDGRGSKGDGGGLRKRLETFVLFLRWSGLAIRDGITCERTRLQDDGKLMLHRTKTGQPVFTKLPAYLVTMLQELPHSNPKYFFWSGNGNPKSAVSDWQRVLRDKLFPLANLGKRAHAHMFRDTFAVEYLIAGMDIKEVSMLLGHSSIRVTEKHYSPWVKARQDKLESSIENAWEVMERVQGSKKKKEKKRVERDYREGREAKGNRHLTGTNATETME